MSKLDQPAALHEHYFYLNDLKAQDTHTRYTVTHKGIGLDLHTAVVNNI